MKTEFKDNVIGVIGLGYVGLPLAIEFGKKFTTIGYDINENRIQELRSFNDLTLEVSSDEIKSVQIESTTKRGLFFSNNKEDLLIPNVYIITVPTPINQENKPNLAPIKSATKNVGQYLKKGDVVIYESTVYPGLTEEICVPILELESNLKFNLDFFVGYSPERINPGDKKRTIKDIIKVTSGSNKEAACFIDSLYNAIIPAGTHLASSIKVAEAAKVIENAQRDINIAFVNELSKIFSLMNIDTNQVLDAAKTKWNFLDFRPGLVGGHCIGVDPYYLAEKSISLGFAPEIILAGRKTNDSMAEFVGSRVLNLLIEKGKIIKNSKILILGFTFKENCPDTRNTKVIDLINFLDKNECNVLVYDPWIDNNSVTKEYNISITSDPYNSKYDAIILAVSHKNFEKINLNKLKNDDDTIIYDIKNFYKEEGIYKL